MIGIVIVTHGQLGKALIDTSELILNARPRSVVSVSINLEVNVDKLREKITEGIKKVDTNDGLLILTDMFGGTPSNLSYSFLEEGRAEVISGVNLPVLIKAVTDREKMELCKLAERLETYGKKSISSASGILKGNKRS